MAEPMITYFDRAGDTRLIVQGQSASQPEQTFVVSSKAMMMVCDAWNRMLSPDGYFKESKKEDDGTREIQLPDDKPDGMAILLDIAHLNFDRVPDMLEFRTLLSVAVVIEKYEAARVIRPWARKWIEATQHLAQTDGHEQWLWIAWAFGETEIFKRLAKGLVQKAHVNNRGQCVNAIGMALDPLSNYVHLPPDIIESILDIRTASVNQLLDTCYQLGDRYSSDQCQFGGGFLSLDAEIREKAECNAICYGSLLLALRKTGLAPQKKSAADIKYSVRDLYNILRAINILSHPSQYKHGKCNPQDELMASLDRVIQDIPSPVLESHKRHMERRKKELTISLPSRSSERSVRASGHSIKFSFPS